MKSRRQLFIAALFLSLWRQSAVDRGLSVKPGLGHSGLRHTVQTQIRRYITWRLIRMCTVCLNYRNLRVKCNSLKYPFRTFVSAYTQKQASHQCRQCFDYTYFSSPLNAEHKTETINRTAKNMKSPQRAAIVAQRPFFAGHCVLPKIVFNNIRFITKTRLFKYTENFTTKKWNFSDTKFKYFSYFCSKHRLWVLVRTASSRRF